MAQVTNAQLERAVEALNSLTHSPSVGWTNGDSNVGHYLLDYAYGRIALHRMVNTAGAIEDVFGFRTTKAIMYNLLYAFMKGYKAAEEKGNE